MIWRRRLGAGAGTLDWWVAWLFIVGAALFALGSIPPYAQMVDSRAVGITFVVGSVFFTAAAACAMAQALRDRVERRLVWACAVQLLGTAFFNVSTARGLQEAFDDAGQANRLVWAPDFFGSIAFLVASHLAWIVVCGSLWRIDRADVAWWVAAVNYVGSILFMASALASYTLETTDEEVNQALVNSTTFAGALCFLVGAYLLLTPADDEGEAPATAG